MGAVSWVPYTRLLTTSPSLEIGVAYKVLPSYSFNIHFNIIIPSLPTLYMGADKSLARPTSLFILFYSWNISFDASLVMYINSTNIPPIMIINRIYEIQNLLSL
jgi:hypothetical protein